MIRFHRANCQARALLWLKLVLGTNRKGTLSRKLLEISMAPRREPFFGIVVCTNCLEKTNDRRVYLKSNPILKVYCLCFVPFGFQKHIKNLQTPPNKSPKHLPKIPRNGRTGTDGTDGTDGRLLGFLCLAFLASRGFPWFSRSWRSYFRPF